MINDQFSTLLRLLFAAALLRLTGCGCSAKVSITNSSSSAYRVQVSLPYPSYELAKEHCRFDTILDSHERWSTSTAASADRAYFAMTRPNGPLMVRLRPSDDAAGEWKTYSIAIHDY